MVIAFKKVNGEEKAKRGNNVVDVKKLHNPKRKQSRFTKVEDHNELLNIHLHTDVPGSDSPSSVNWWRLGGCSGTCHYVPALFLIWFLGSLFWSFSKIGYRTNWILPMDINITASKHSYVWPVLFHIYSQILQNVFPFVLGPLIMYTLFFIFSVAFLPPKPHSERNTYSELGKTCQTASCKSFKGQRITVPTVLRMKIKSIINLS